VRSIENMIKCKYIEQYRILTVTHNVKEYVEREWNKKKCRGKEFELQFTGTKMIDN
jgi:hypothetical protein